MKLFSNFKPYQVYCCADKFKPTSETAAAFELDGEWVGKLPVTFSVERERMRVVVPRFLQK